jgi:tetratricopeptide (TPR) repeat protein
MRHPQRIFAVMLVLSLVIATRSGYAQGTITVGARVVTKNAVPLRVGGELADDGTAFRVYSVGRVDSCRLWLVSNEVRGWANSNQVIPLEQAADFFSHEIQVQPLSAEAHRRRGMVFATKGETDAAFAELSEAIRLNPSCSMAFLDRGAVWLQVDDSSRAAADFSEAIRLDSRNAVAFSRRGVIRLASNELGAALADFDKAIEINPKFAVAFANRGLVWRGNKAFARALVDLDSAIALNPECARALWARGDVWCSKCEFDRALLDLNKSIQLDATNADAFCSRAKVWCYKYQFQKALADYDEAIRLEPNRPVTLSNRGVLCASNSEFARAIRDFDEAIRLDPHYAAAFNNRGMVRCHEKEFDNALADFGEAIRLDPKCSRAFNNRALIWWARGDFKQAISDFNDAIQLSFNNRLALRNYAWLLATCADARHRSGNKAVELATNACELGRWTDFRDIVTLAAASAEVGDFRDAMARCEQALTLASNPTDRAEVDSYMRLFREKKPFRQRPGSTADHSDGRAAVSSARGGDMRGISNWAMLTNESAHLDPVELQIYGTAMMSTVAKQLDGRMADLAEDLSAALRSSWSFHPLTRPTPAP